MKKLGLENKQQDENRQRMQELEMELAACKVLLAEKDAQLGKKDQVIQSFMSGEIAACIDKYQTSTNSMLKNILDKMKADGYTDLSDYLYSEFSKTTESVSQLTKRLNYLSLSEIKKSERFVSRDENGLAEGQTIDSEDKNIKHPKKRGCKSTRKQ